jgi:hypothetical protein
VAPPHRDAFAALAQPNSHFSCRTEVTEAFDSLVRLTEGQH